MCLTPVVADGNHRRGRDDPRVIRRRAVITSLLAATAWIPLKLTYPDDDWAQLRRKLGLRPAGAFRAAATAVGLCVCLFAGPLCMAHADSQLTSRRTLQSRAAWWRNIVVVRSQRTVETQIMSSQFTGRPQAPLTEEFFFRGCMCPLLLSGRWTTGQVIVGCPVFFGKCSEVHRFYVLMHITRMSGIAHAHHVLELRGIRGMPWRAACMQVGFQVMYTTVRNAESSGPPHHVEAEVHVHLVQNRYLARSRRTSSYAPATWLPQSLHTCSATCKACPTFDECLPTARPCVRP